MGDDNFYKQYFLLKLDSLHKSVIVPMLDNIIREHSSVTIIFTPAYVLKKEKKV
jgi:hypothetical protein